MNLDYSISNFRVIDHNGTYVDLRPITILTGCNNSGKSSIVKSLCLMKDFFRQIEDDLKNDKKIKLHSYKLDFHKRPHDVLGSFSQVVHEENGEDETIDSKLFSVELSSYSHFFMQYVKLKLTFCELEDDELNNGYLHSISIKDMDDHVLFASNRDGEMEYDFSKVKKELLFFLYTQHFMAKRQNEYGYCQAMGEVIRPDSENAKNFGCVFKALVEAFNGRGVIELIEWHTLPYRNPGEFPFSGCSEEILLDSVLITSDFIESPILSVFSFFPFMKGMKGISKDECILTIEKAIEKSNNINAIDKKLISTLLTNFKDSNFDTLVDMFSALENDRFFIQKKSKTIRVNGEIFPMYYIWVYDRNVIYEESDIPEKLNYGHALLAFDRINQIITGSSSYVDYDEVDDGFHYFLSNKVPSILIRSIEDILLQSMPGDFSYTRTSLVNVKRLYGLEDDNDFSDMLKTFFESKRRLVEAQKKNSFSKSPKYEACSFLNKWINEFGVAQRVDIKSHADGYGVTIRLYSNETDQKGMLLADKGYGCTQLFSILLKIESAILQSIRLSLTNHFNTQGIGECVTKYMRSYSQLYPITIALEEPENHLHPSFQSLLADMILDAYSNYGIQFIVESHSEYFIRKMQLLVAQKKINADSISLLYVNSVSRPSYLPMISDIGIEEDGNLKNVFGPGFFDESIRLSKELFNTTKDADEE